MDKTYPLSKQRVYEYFKMILILYPCALGKVSVSHIDGFVIVQCFSECDLPHAFILANQAKFVKRHPLPIEILN